MPAGASAFRPNWLPACKNSSITRMASGEDIPRMNDRKSRTQRQVGAPATNGPPDAAVDQERIQAAVREILLAVGEDPDREGLRDTPARVGRMYAELFSGLGKDPRALLTKSFTQKYEEMVLVKDIGFASICEHHL